jgi:hypothetical protein
MTGLCGDCERRQLLTPRGAQCAFCGSTAIEQRRLCIEPDSWKEARAS